jgi:hypothetical protein
MAISACVTSPSRLVVVLAGLAGSVFGCAATAISSVTVIAHGGMNAPGTNARFTESFGSPTLDESGAVLFRAQLTGSGITTSNDFGLWFGQPSALQLVAREGDAAPDCDGAVYNVLGTPILSAGRVAFVATLTGSGVTTANNQAIFSGSPGNIRLVMRKGTQAPGQPGGCVYGQINDFAIGSTGNVAFRSLLAGTGVVSGNDTAVSLSVNGNVIIGVREGAPLTSISPTAAVGDLTSGNLTLNALNEVECVSTVTGAGAGTTQGLWRISQSGVQIVGRSRLAAPGTPAGQTWLDFFSTTALNGSGRSTFSATLQGTGVNTGNTAGLWAGSPGSLSLVIRYGDLAPGTLLSLQAFSTTPHINAAGDTAFAATLTGPGSTSTNNCGVWSIRGGQGQLLAQAGEQVPGFAPGVLFSPEPATRVAINDAGDVIMRWKVLDGSGTPQVVLKRSATGTWQTMLREGQTITLSDATTKTVSVVWVVSNGHSAGNDGRGSFFNTSGLAAGLVGLAEGGFAVIRMEGRCPADFNDDGVVDFFDYLDFAAAFSSNDPTADFNEDGLVDFFDYLDFVAAFSVPC